MMEMCLEPATLFLCTLRKGAKLSLHVPRQSLWKSKMLEESYCLPAPPPPFTWFPRCAIQSCWTALTWEGASVEGCLTNVVKQNICPFHIHLAKSWGDESGTWEAAVLFTPLRRKRSQGKLSNPETKNPFWSEGEKVSGISFSKTEFAGHMNECWKSFFKKFWHKISWKPKSKLRQTPRPPQISQRKFTSV